MTSPTSALYAGNISEKKINLGKSLRYFGDGFQIAKVLGNKRLWRIPVMDGEFICEEFAYQTKAIGGGNFLILGKTIDALLKASEKAVSEINKIKNVILPFPGGIVRSGSKVGSKYKNLIASTNFEYCPTLRGIVNSKLDHTSNFVLEIVIDGLTESDIIEVLRWSQSQKKMPKLHDLVTRKSVRELELVIREGFDSLGKTQANTFTKYLPNI